MRVFLPAMLALASLAGPVSAQEFKLETVPSVTSVDVRQLKPKTVLFSDHRNDEIADPTGLIRFEEWARARPLQRDFLSLYPGYVEPTVKVTSSGVTKTIVKKSHMYVAEARFLVGKSPAQLDVAKYATLAVLERMDPAIKHRPIAPADVIPLKDPERAYNRNPKRAWCEPKTQVVCIQSRYQLEGKLPLGIRLVNKLKEGGRKISEVMEFQNELRLVPTAEIDQAGLRKLTALDAPVTAVLEQNIFYVNQVMEFGKLLGVFQQHPADPSKTVATVFMVLAVDTDVLEKKRDYANIPILRNLVPAQVLMGNSSFNTGSSISAGLPAYARNRIKIIAGLLEKD